MYIISAFLLKIQGTEDSNLPMGGVLLLRRIKVK